jgi:hypothetical protein
MGANMVRRLLRRLLKGGHHCVVFDNSPKALEELVAEKATGAASGGVARWCRPPEEPPASQEGAMKTGTVTNTESAAQGDVATRRILILGGGTLDLFFSKDIVQLPTLRSPTMSEAEEPPGSTGHEHESPLLEHSENRP